jgi:glycosyltransferase involved in cell wall biosynthesis
MKIAVNAWFLEPILAQRTGSGQYLTHLLAALREIEPALHIELVEPRKRDKLSKITFEQIDFPRAAKRMQADVAFVPYWGPPLRCDVPLAVTIHDVIGLAMPEYRRGLAQTAYVSLVRSAAQNAEAILTDSAFSKQDIITHLGVPEDRVTVALLGVEPRFTPAQSRAECERVRARYNLPEWYVLYVGGFDPRKNIETLFQVYTWVAEPIGDDYPLVVCGSPDDLTSTLAGQPISLGEMARTLQVEKEIRFIGRPDDVDKPALYAMARALLYPSRYEGFGLPALEAMASGVPVVGSNASSIPEIVGNAGMLVDPLESRRMSGALIATCTEDALHARLRERGLLRAATFTWQRTAYETLAVFNRLSG